MPGGYHIWIDTYGCRCETCQPRRQWKRGREGSSPTGLRPFLSALIHPTSGKMNSRKSRFRIVKIQVYEGGDMRLSAGLMHRRQHYILWCWMIIQPRA
jgi:hypothetical protein